MEQNLIKHGVTTGITAVKVCPAPTSSPTYQVQSLHVSNKDTQALTVILQLNDGGTLRILRQKSLVAGVKANETLTFGSNITDGETVTVDNRVYTFQDTLTDVDGNIHIGASAAATLTNLINAVNNSGGTPGTDYAASNTIHHSVSAAEGAGDTGIFTAKVAGTAGNSIPTTEAATGATWGDTTMSGGVDPEQLEILGPTMILSSNQSLEVRLSRTPTTECDYACSYAMEAAS